MTARKDEHLFNINQLTAKIMTQQENKATIPNPPAFPLQYDPYVDHPAHGRIHRSSIGEEVQEGMTLRDYFAAKAMMIHMQCAEKGNNEHVIASTEYLVIAEYSYQMADAMLNARLK